jgi:hypothetical protein
MVARPKTRPPGSRRFRFTPLLKGTFRSASHEWTEQILNDGLSSTRAACARDDHNLRRIARSRARGRRRLGNPRPGRREPHLPGGAHPTRPAVRASRLCGGRPDLPAFGSTHGRPAAHRRRRAFQGPAALWALRREGRPSVRRFLANVSARPQGDRAQGPLHRRHDRLRQRHPLVGEAITMILGPPLVPED